MNCAFNSNYHRLLGIEIIRIDEMDDVLREFEEVFGTQLTIATTAFTNCCELGPNPTTRKNSHEFFFRNSFELKFGHINCMSEFILPNFATQNLICQNNFFIFFSVVFEYFFLKHIMCKKYFGLIETIKNIFKLQIPAADAV
jgi:hypothetical protein